MTIYAIRCRNRKCRLSRQSDKHMPYNGTTTPCQHCGTMKGWYLEATNPNSRRDKPKFELTAQIAHTLFAYDIGTGVITRRVSAGRCAAGDVCESKKQNGYIQIEVGGHNYLAHRVAWLLATGEWPSENIDHIDGDGLNNAGRNLRDVEQRLNLENQKVAHTNSLLGVLGVSQAVRNGNYFSRITVNNVVRHLGTFSTPELAHAAYLTAKRELHEGNTL